MSKKRWHYCRGARKAGTGQDCPLKHKVKLGGWAVSVTVDDPKPGGNA